MKEKEYHTKTLIRLLEHFFELLPVLFSTKQADILNLFTLYQGSQKRIDDCPCTVQKVLISIYRPSKKYSSRDPVPLSVLPDACNRFS
jgi:hypothetical protein